MEVLRGGGGGARKTIASMRGLSKYYLHYGVGLENIREHGGRALKK